MVTQAKPPLTEEQLVMIALLLSGKAMDEKEIFTWLIDHFRYFHDIAVDALHNQSQHMPSHFNYHPSTQPHASFLQDFHDVFMHYETPLRRVGRQQYTVTPFTVERAFRSVIDGDDGDDDGRNNTPFQFFKLPAELRNVVYEGVFRYPAGIFLWYQRVYALAIPEPIQGVASFETFQTAIARNNLLQASDSRDILSPLLVSHQFCREARPFFYSVNHFYFDSPASMQLLLQRIPESHSRYIREVSFQYDQCGYAAENLEELVKLEDLRKLTMCFDEEDYYRRNRSDESETKHQMVMKLPGLGKLRNLRGLEKVTFLGCPTIEGILKDDMLKPKSEPEPVAAPVKSVRWYTPVLEVFRVGSIAARLPKAMRIPKRTRKAT